MFQVQGQGKAQGKGAAVGAEAAAAAATREEEALVWLRKAAGMGCGAAYLNLGLWHLRAKDDKAYLECVAKAARSGDVAALMRMGREFVSGERLVPDDKAASRWLLSAAEQEVRSCSRGSRPSLNADDWFLIAHRLEHGVGVAVDLGRAARYYSTAQQLGSTRADVRLAALRVKNARSAQEPRDLLGMAQQLRQAVCMCAFVHVRRGGRRCLRIRMRMCPPVYLALGSRIVAIACGRASHASGSCNQCK